MEASRDRRQYGSGKVVKGHPSPKEIKLAVNGLKEVEARIQKQGFDLVILDELNVALTMGLLEREVVESFLDRWHGKVEIIATGRGAPSWLLEKADLVTEMVERKHYFSQGVKAREGIEK